MEMTEEVCSRCGEPVVKRGWFWVLKAEAQARTVTRCPDALNGLHDPEEEEG